MSFARNAFQDDLDCIIQLSKQVGECFNDGTHLEAQELLDKAIEAFTKEYEPKPTANDFPKGTSFYNPYDR